MFCRGHIDLGVCLLCDGISVPFGMLCSVTDSAGVSSDLLGGIPKRGYPFGVSIPNINNFDNFVSCK